MRIRPGSAFVDLLVVGAVLLLSYGLAEAGDPIADLDALEAELAQTDPVELGPTERTRSATMVTVDCQPLTQAQKVTMMFLQGLANRRGPRLFLSGLDTPSVAADRWWARHLEDEYGVARRSLAWKRAMRQFGPELGGLIMWDAQLPSSQNIAGMLGSVFSWLPCALDDLAAVRQATGLEVVFDLRERWSDPIEAQRWALEHVAPKLSTEEIGCIGTREPEARLCRDWLMMRAAPMVDLSSRVESERALKDEYFARMTPLSIVWGWLMADPAEYVEHSSRRGLRVICSTNSPNLSLLSQIRPKRASWTQPHSEPLGEIGEKAYLSFVLAGGDTAPAMLTRQWGQWDDAARGDVPFAWEVQPVLTRVAPVVLESYYDSASPLDRFICGPSGAGYAQLLLLPNLGAFMADTAAACAECDLDIVGVHAAFTPDVAQDWAANFPDSKGFIYGWGGQPEMLPRAVEGRPHAYYALMPEPPDGEKTKEYYEAVAAEVRDIIQSRGMPCVVLVHMLPPASGPDDVPRIVECLGDLPVEIVPIDTAMELTGRIIEESPNGGNRFGGGH